MTKTVERLASVKHIARVKEAFLGWEDHGILTAWLDVDYGGTGQGIGLHSLDSPQQRNGKTIRVGTAYGMEYVCRLLRACGVDEWSKLPGRHIYVIKADESWNAKVLGIAPLPMERGEPFFFAQLKDDMGTPCT